MRVEFSFSALQNAYAPGSPASAQAFWKRVSECTGTDTPVTPHCPQFCQCCHKCISVVDLHECGVDTIVGEIKTYECCVRFQDMSQGCATKRRYIVVVQIQLGEDSVVENACGQLHYHVSLSNQSRFDRFLKQCCTLRSGFAHLQCAKQLKQVRDQRAHHSAALIRDQ